VDSCHANVAYVCTTGEKSSAMHKACQYSTIEMIDFLVSRGGDKLFETPDGRGFTPLMIAASEGRNEIVTLMVEKYKCNINFTTDINPLFIAIQNDVIPTVEHLLRLGADPNAIQEKMQCRPLHIAASNNFLLLVTTLCDHGAIVDCEDPRGYTPLFMAAAEGYTKCVKLLLHYGANIHHRSHSDNTTAIFHSIMSNRVDTVKLMLEEGSNPYDTKSQEGLTLEEVSKEKGNIKMANLLGGWLTFLEKNGTGQLCSVCCKYLEKPKKCGKCKSRYYCSAECQKQDWTEHKKECKAPETV